MKKVLLKIKKVLLDIWRFFVRVYNYFTIERLSLEDVLDMTSDGKVFSAEFIKKDNTIRTINCRTGVVKHLKGGTLRFDPISRNLLTVFDMSKNGYRFISFDRLNWIKIGGKKYTNFKR